MDVQDLVDASDLVLEARILSARPLETSDGRLETELLLEVDRTFEGNALAYRSIRVPGGVRDDGSGMLLAGMPHLGAGEDVLLFLTQPGRTGVRMPVGLAQGKFRVERTESGTKRLAREIGGLGLIDPASGTLRESHGQSVHDYAVVIAEIEAALATKRSR